ncbi:UbiA family prenyltransferase [Kutzneria kofuensis]|uniref:4-hydroxybenzoate polyprenyltransferase n=1 Tax=Kutzneria kofuensis TaxID=103725 RepID=A0A7W9KNB5_9PSEU|nr:UbiA family prenyltransferase [Kutzneria kofuensis]MBB5895723.1 4-hydroxybenzoate polyprenyltransferase [Kutzneria kofuensis]
MSTVSGLVRASHPAPAAAVTVIFMGLAVVWGRSPAGIAAVGAAILTGQLSVGWLNDYLDRDRDAAAKRADKPIPNGDVSARTVLVAFVVAAVAVVPLSFLSGLVAGVVHLFAVLSAWSYNAVLKGTVLSVLPYALSFAAGPAFVVLGLPATPPWWLLVAGALLGSGAHFANTLPDVAADLATGVRGLPQRLGPRRSWAATVVLLLAAGAVLNLYAVPLSAIVLLYGRRHPFQAAMAVALIDVLLLIITTP